MKRIILPSALAACLSLAGCASTSPQAVNYERLEEPVGTVATSGGGGSSTGAVGAAYAVAATAVGTAVQPGYLDSPPAPYCYPPDTNPEPYPR
jgi:hypothetical protein